MFKYLLARLQTWQTVNVVVYLVVSLDRVFIYSFFQTAYFENYFQNKLLYDTNFSYIVHNFHGYYRLVAVLSNKHLMSHMAKYTHCCTQISKTDI